MAVTARTWTSGEVVTAAMMNTLRDDINTVDTGPGFIATGRVTSTHTNATTTLSDVTGISFAIAASEIWAFVAFIHTNAPAAADIKFDCTVPSGATGRLGTHGGTVEVPPGSATIGTTVAVSTSGAQIMVTVAGTIVNSTNAGTVQLQSAQVVASGTNSILINSWFVAVRLL